MLQSQERCKKCSSKLVKRETQKKASQLKQAYYYTAYYFCTKCGRIYHSDKFKVINNNFSTLFDWQIDSRFHPKGASFFEAARGNYDGKDGNDRVKRGFAKEEYDVEIWTDGACVFNGQKCARAAWAFVSDKKEEAGLVSGKKQTNNVAEALAIFHALEWAARNKFKKIKIYTDSQITIHSLNKPVDKIKANREIFKKIVNLIKQYNLIVYFEKVIGHSGDENNERADRLANQLAEKQ